MTLSREFSLFSCLVVVGNLRKAQSFHQTKVSQVCLPRPMGRGPDDMWATNMCKWGALKHSMKLRCYYYFLSNKLYQKFNYL